MPCCCENVKFGTFENAVRVSPFFTDYVYIDKCIADEVFYLWAKGIVTTGCCCGHNKVDGTIGVEERYIQAMKDLGYINCYNRQHPLREDVFYAKTVFPIYDVDVSSERIVNEKDDV